MALNREIWVSDIVEDFFPNNEFISRSVDHSQYVNNKTVHVPNAGTPPEIKKNRGTFPATAQKRQDSDLTYNIDSFSATPIHIQNAEIVELSYDKRASVLAQMKSELQRVAIESILHSWIPASPALIKTSGVVLEAHIDGATGNRNAFGVKDVKAIKMLFDRQDVPSEGRYILIDSDMYNELLSEMTDGATMNFLSGADPERGVVGRFMGFDFYSRSKVLKTTAAGSLKEWTASNLATDCAAGLAWQANSVSRALGEVSVFSSEQDPLYYGDIMSCEVRAGGTCVRADKKGLALIYQGTAE